MGFDFLSFVTLKATADSEIRKWKSRLKVRRCSKAFPPRELARPVPGEENSTHEGISPTVSILLNNRNSPRFSKEALTFRLSARRSISYFLSSLVHLTLQ